VKVEQALRLLPSLEVLGPLRGLVLASSAPDETSRWGSAAPYLTVGKWALSVEVLRRGIPQCLARISDHIGRLYQHYASALEADDLADHPQVVVHLLAAARMEEQVGRYAAALAWGEVALGVAERLNTRATEVETLIFLGDVGRAQGEFAAAARHYQRALALAEAEFDPAGVILASEGQGLVALAEDQLQGAAVWLGRAEQLASGDLHAPARAKALRALAEVSRRQGDLHGAGERLHRSRGIIERLGIAPEMARTLDAQGRLEMALGRTAAALAAFREALAWVRRGGRDPRLECTIRIHLAEYFLEMDRVSEGEEELRHAERLAIDNDLGRRLVEIYTRLGTLRGAQGAETGFVFFEQALALCRLLDPAPAFEGRVYRRYGLFKAALGRTEEARGWLERARELLATAGGTTSLDEIDAELDRIPA
jgi:tetratricopeptide (TPR) repeat protein